MGVVGELLVTVGVVVLLYVVWQLWVGDLIVGAQENAEGRSLSETWEQEYRASPTPVESAVVEPPVLPASVDGETFAILRIPRFGEEFAPRIAGGTTRERTLDTGRVGHYTDADMPGAVGNFAIAAHRTTYGAPFKRIAELRVGDAIVVETEDGWYTYRFRNLQYVTPTQTDVLLDVPQKPDAPATERYITMTSCSPMFSLTERIIGYGVFESYTPRTSPPPASLEGI